MSTTNPSCGCCNGDGNGDGGGDRADGSDNSYKGGGGGGCNSCCHSNGDDDGIMVIAAVVSFGDLSVCFGLCQWK